MEKTHRIALVCLHGSTKSLIAAASSALAGRPEQAQRALARLRQLDHTLRVSNLRDTIEPYRRPEDLARLEEGLRKAGLPESSRHAARQPYATAGTVVI